MIHDGCGSTLTSWAISRLLRCQWMEVVLRQKISGESTQRLSFWYCWLHSSSFIYLPSVTVREWVNIPNLHISIAWTMLYPINWLFLNSPTLPLLGVRLALCQMARKWTSYNLYLSSHTYAAHFFQKSGRNHERDRWPDNCKTLIPSFAVDNDIPKTHDRKCGDYGQNPQESGAFIEGICGAMY